VVTVLIKWQFKKKCFVVRPGRGGGKICGKKRAYVGCDMANVGQLAGEASKKGEGSVTGMRVVRKRQAGRKRVQLCNVSEAREFRKGQGVLRDRVVDLRAALFVSKMAAPTWEKNRIVRHGKEGKSNLLASGLENKAKGVRIYRALEKELIREVREKAIEPAEKASESDSTEAKIKRPRKLCGAGD